MLVGGFDKPILDALEKSETACTNRDYPRAQYGAIKDSDAHVRFTAVCHVGIGLHLEADAGGMRRVVYSPRAGLSA